jgi:hypothetical protein
MVVATTTRNSTILSEEAAVHKDSMPLRTYYVVLLFVAAFSIWIRTGFPVYAIGPASYDDQLFIRTARYLEAGQWLGPYDQLTLAKGMFYPLFIVIAFWTSVPLKIAEQGVYLAASALTAGVVRRQSGSGRFALVLFALLAFNPLLWNVSLARVIREALYISLSLAVVTLVVMIAFPPVREANQGFRRAVFQGFSLGLVGAAYWMTREEGIWLLPALAVVMTVSLLGILRPRWIPITESGPFPPRFGQLKAIALPLALALIVFTAADWMVAGLNYRHYGIFETNELRSKSFVRAYGALSRIKHDEWHRYIPFPKDARQRAYAVSPAARELANSLEGPTGSTWLRIACSWVETKPCVEVQAGWEMWELRNAVADAGHYRTGAEAIRFYDTLANQINSACDRGTIPCLPRRTTMLPPFRWEYVGETVQAAKLISKAMFTMGNGQVGSATSVGSADEIAIFADTVGGVYLPETVTHFVRGWIASASVTPTIHLVPHTLAHVESSLGIMAAPDVLAVYPNLKAIRFELRTDCPVASCDLVVDVAGAGQSSIPLAQLVHSGAISIPGLQVQVDSVSGGEDTKLRDSRRTLQVKIAAVIASAYATAFPVLAIFGAAGLLLATFLRRLCPIPTGLLALGLGSAVAVCTRIVLLAYLDATSFPSANLHYTSPASPFVIIFTTVGVYSWYVIFWRFASRRDPLSNEPCQL